MRCGYCYEKGHNKRTCAKLRGDAASGNAYAQRRLPSPPSNRRCSYCGDVGHSKRTCTRASEDIVTKTAELKAIRQKFVNFCQEKSLGVGSLLLIDYAYPEHTSALFLVFGIREHATSDAHLTDLMRAIGDRDVVDEHKRAYFADSLLSFLKGHRRPWGGGQLQSIDVVGGIPGKGFTLQDLERANPIEEAVRKALNLG